MVTHPMGLDYHKSERPWQKIFDKALDMGYRSHKTSTCGLHIHVSRDALGPDHDAQEETIARIVYFVEAHWNELLKFSGRTEANIMRWASRYGIEEDTKATYDKAKKDSFNRYVCVNLQNYNTVEFRIFRGTLKYETFMATLQLVHEICDMIRVLNLCLTILKMSLLIASLLKMESLDQNLGTSKLKKRLIYQKTVAFYISQPLV